MQDGSNYNNNTSVGADGNNDNANNANNDEKKPITIRLIVMGGGYDVRSLKLLEQQVMSTSSHSSLSFTQSSNIAITTTSAKTGKRAKLQKALSTIKSRLKRQNDNDNNKHSDSSTTTTNTTNSNDPPNSHAPTFYPRYQLECYELDLPEVVRAKTELLQKRLFRRRPWLSESSTDATGATLQYPILIAADFNNVDETRRLLEDILSRDEKHPQGMIPTVFLFEGVMIYLNKGVPHALLEMCSQVLRNHYRSRNDKDDENSTNGDVSTANAAVNASVNAFENEIPMGFVCFADRLDNIPGGDEKLARIELRSTGWELMDWLPKPGLARHMGVGRLIG